MAWRHPAARPVGPGLGPWLLGLLLLLPGGVGAQPAGAVTPPVITHFEPAPFPPAAQAAGVEASVLLELSIDATGAVTEVVSRAVEPGRAAGQGFEAAASRAARAFRFRPAARAGVPIAVRILYRYRFVLSAPPPPPAAPSTPAAVAPQPEVLAGQIRARGTREPIPLAEVRLTPLRSFGPPPAPVVVTADAQGRFVVRARLSGRFRVQVSAYGFVDFTATEELNPWERVGVEYYLHARPGRYETVVRAERDRIEVARQSLDNTELQRIPGTFGDALRVLQSLPGVARTPFGAGALIVRGQGPRDSRVYLDGIEVPVLFHFGGLTSVYPSATLSRIDFYPGGFPARFGRASAGVVDVETRHGRRDGLHGHADLSVLDVNLLLEGPIGKHFSFVVSGRRSHFDAILPAVLPRGDDFNLAVAPRYYDYQGKLTWHVPPTGPWTQQLSLVLFGSDDALSFLRDNESGPLYEQRGTFNNQTQFLRTGLRWMGRKGKDVELELVPFYGLDRSLLRIGALPFEQQMTGHTFGLRQNSRLRLSRWLVLRAGLDWLLGQSTLTSNVPIPLRPGQVADPLRPRGEQSGAQAVAFANLGAWAELQVSLGPTLDLFPGLRLDYYHLSREPIADPRLSARWRAGRTTTLKAATGVYHRPPSLVDVDPVYGNPELKSTWSIQYSAGIEQRITRDLSVDLVLFYNDLYDLPVPAGTYVVGPGGVPRYLPPPGLGIATAQSLNQFPQGYQTNDGRGRAYGGELLVRHARTRRFFGWLSYTLMRSELRDLPTLPYRPYQYDQTHILSLVGSLRLKYGFEVGLRFRLVSGNPYTPVGGSYLDADRLAYMGVVGGSNSERLPLFHQLDLRVDKTFTFRLWQLNAYLDIQNVYSYRSVEAIQHSFDFKQRQFIEGLPIVPVLGVKGTF